MNREDGKSLTPKHFQLDAHELSRKRTELVAAKLAKLSHQASYLYRMKYSGQIEWGARLAAWLRNEIDREAIRENWGRRHQLALVDIAIEEIITDGECAGCGGEGRRKVGQDMKICPRCGGSGRHRLSNGAKARALGVSHSDWSRRWRRRYDAVKELLDELEEEISRTR